MPNPLPPFDWIQQVARHCVAPLKRYEVLASYNHLVFRLETELGNYILKVATQASASTLAREAAIYDRLQSTRIPLPRVWHVDRAGTDFGRPLLILADAGRDNLAEAAARSAEPVADAAAWYKELAIVLADIHAVKWDEVIALPDRSSSVERQNSLLMRLRRGLSWAERQRFLTPGELAPLANPPNEFLFSFTGNSLCHGDFHAHQCIVADGIISAVIDWHDAHRGAPRVEFIRALTTIGLYAMPQACYAFAAQYAKTTQTAPGIASEPERLWALAQSLALLHAAHRQQNPIQLRQAIEQYRRIREQPLFRPVQNE